VQHIWEILSDEERQKSPEGAEAKKFRLHVEYLIRPESTSCEVAKTVGEDNANSKTEHLKQYQREIDDGSRIRRAARAEERNPGRRQQPEEISGGKS
jgi:hypothetical protein